MTINDQDQLYNPMYPSRLLTIPISGIIIAVFPLQREAVYIPASNTFHKQTTGLSPLEPKKK